MDEIRRKEIEEILVKANIDDPGEVLLTFDEVYESLGLTKDEIEHIKTEAANKIGDPFMPLDEVFEKMKSKWQQISFGCVSLNKITQGGLYTRGINEIYGESGTGKTQILLQLSLMVQLPKELGGLGKGAVFIYTEGQFPSKRHAQLIDHFKRKYENLNINFLENTYIEQLMEMKDLVNCICVRLPNLVAAKNIGIIIIDSVAAAFRPVEDLKDRAKNMRRVGQTLYKLVDKHECVVVCSNQVTTDMDSDSEDKIVPCLGLAWGNLVRTRLEVVKAPNAENESDTKTIRRMQVIFAPELPSEIPIDFAITSEGVVDVQS